MNSKVTPNSKTNEPCHDQKRPWQTPDLQEADYQITGDGIFAGTDGPGFADNPFSG
jgi:hypothetical protein